MSESLKTLSLSVQHKVKNEGMKKGQGLRLLKRPWHLHCLENGFY